MLATNVIAALVIIEMSQYLGIFKSGRRVKSVVYIYMPDAAKNDERR
jgi:hypothetical protein